MSQGDNQDFFDENQNSKNWLKAIETNKTLLEALANTQIESTNSNLVTRLVDLTFLANPFAKVGSVALDGLFAKVGLHLQYGEQWSQDKWWKSI